MLEKDTIGDSSAEIAGPLEETARGCVLREAVTPVSATPGIAAIGTVLAVVGLGTMAASAVVEAVG
ncbi:hypothetical protein AAH978_04715 [Streptomyces sp. ZYX-F-203]